MSASATATATAYSSDMALDTYPDDDDCFCGANQAACARANAACAAKGEGFESSELHRHRRPHQLPWWRWASSGSNGLQCSWHRRPHQPHAPHLLGENAPSRGSRRVCQRLPLESVW